MRLYKYFFYFKTPETDKFRKINKNLLNSLGKPQTNFTYTLQTKFLDVITFSLQNSVRFFRKLENIFKVCTLQAKSTKFWAINSAVM